MSDQAGSSVAAIQQRQAALARKHSAIADADRTLADVLTSAHQAVRDSARRLETIAAEIDRAVPQHGGSGGDTTLGAREFQRFLVAKQREIAAVVASAREVSRTKSAVLQGLQDQYSIHTG
ncbi:DUF4226 domain-containing protein [Mycobacterium vicinigordonae]|uniref:DUF4226 domain-containing protein n=1 Tax=Mycobacterium vicinigordonae TaxID=1719132 RepID=A0A7D6I8V5_9MYCO|nr:DUF4226 domain-containing protein [Mycobacterium vicinigordonae]QLL07497.1 DUF4226 domain-containing protein [Mycobacterium vicinigordonae]